MRRYLSVIQCNKYYITNMYKVIAKTDKKEINPCEERKLYRGGII